MTSPTKSHDGQLTTKDELFALSFLKYFDAGKAWLEVTPDGNPKFASQNGNKWLKKPVIRSYLQEAAAEKLENASADADAIINELARIAFLDPIEFMNVDEEGEPSLNLTAITPENRRLLKIKFGIGISKEGDRIKTYQVETYDKMDAIEKLLKIHQLYKGDDIQTQQTAIQVNVNFPLPGSNWRKDQTNQPDVIDSQDV